MKKRIIALICAAVMLFAASGCKPKGDDVDVEATGSPKPEYQVISEGGQEVQGINAKSLTITPKPDGAKATISFVLGSEASNVDEASAESVPKYKTYMTDHPKRFVVEFESLDYWVFDRTFEIDEESPLFYDVFKVLNTRDERFYIVFQLRKDVTATVEAVKDTMTIDFTLSADQPEGTAFYAISDATQPYNEGKISKPQSLFPTLSNDLNNVLLISKPFADEADAKKYVQQLIADNAELDEKNTFVGAVDGNELPGYGSSEDFEIVNSQTILRRNGEDETLPVMMPDGLYMCSTADGSKHLFTKQQRDDGDDEPTQQLWTMDSAGKLKLLTEIEFADIAKAAFSPQGNKLALLERTADSSYLYIYDMETNTLDNLGEEGLGNTTSTFIWDTLGTAIYAISGNENQQLLKFDFTVTDEDARLSAVDEQPIGEGDLGIYNGELYFANISSEDTEMIYKIKPEGGMRTEFAEGGSFRISPDGKNMAILRSSLNSAQTDDETTDTTSLIIKNMATGEEKSIVDNSFIVTYDFSPDGKLYYTQGANADLDSYKLMCYDIAQSATAEIAEMVTSDFNTAPDPNYIYIPLINEELKIHATYKLKLN